MPIDLKDKRKTGGTISERKSIADRKNILDRAAVTRDKVSSLSQMPLSTRNSAASNIASVRSSVNLGDYEYLKKQILGITKVDLNAYKEAQMKRRIDQLITKKGLKDYPTSIC